MSGIPTWHERAMRHPDHQTGMVSEDMIRARMAEAWDLGRTYGINNIAADANPYRGRRRAKP